MRAKFMDTIEQWNTNKLEHWIGKSSLFLLEDFRNTLKLCSMNAQTLQVPVLWHIKIQMWQGLSLAQLFAKQSILLYRARLFNNTRLFPIVSISFLF